MREKKKENGEQLKLAGKNSTLAPNVHAHDLLLLLQHLNAPSKLVSVAPESINSMRNKGIGFSAMSYKSRRVGNVGNNTSIITINTNQILVLGYRTCTCIRTVQSGDLFLDRFLDLMLSQPKTMVQVRLALCVALVAICCAQVSAAPVRTLLQEAGEDGAALDSQGAASSDHLYF